MPSKPIYTEIAGQRVKLTNLDKIIYPEPSHVKAEIINYYITNAELILRGIKGRPLTLIRWPDGVDGKKFYSKNKPKWSPGWITTQRLTDPKDTNEYVIANDTATVAWLSNLAALELHPMQSKVGSLEYPDHIIFDLDPEDDQSFDQLKEVAILLRAYLVNLDYHPFIKTSGSKGLHIYVPIEAKWKYKEVITTVKELTKIFIKEKAPFCTLAVHKEKRKGKVLIDIYRNHQGNTCVAPYSLRGRSDAPVSTPIHWEELPDLSSSRQFTLANIQDRIAKEKPWKEFFTKQKPLHDRSNRTVIGVKGEEEKDAEKNKSLDKYKKKRDFSKTEEPAAEVDHSSSPSVGNRFVIQLHDASNLHYDLRLESEGVLWSWAIPKALPIKKDKVRLAIRTEDHPVKYLNFEGTIPKGEYGGGEMWIMEQGTIEWIEKKEKKLKFKLIGTNFNCAINLFQTKNNQWLAKAIEASNIDIYDRLPKPMLADAAKAVPTGSQYHFEIKWDGIRVFIHVTSESLEIYSRSGRKLTKQFPELVADRKAFEIEDGIFDGEIVVLDKMGKPIFADVISRMHTLGERSIQQKSKTKVATCYIFDALQIDGHQQMHKPQVRRHSLLSAVLPKMTKFRVSQAYEDGKGLWAAVQAQGLEGIMAKDKTAKYFPGQRNRAWLKIKVRQEINCLVTGYTQGEGDRSELFGSLHLIEIKEAGNVYVGKVGTGFDHDTMKQIQKRLEPLKRIPKPIPETIDEANKTTWIEPTYICKIEFASRTKDGILREPVWKGWND